MPFFQLTSSPLSRIRRLAFTLVELLVVIAIIGMLMSILLPAVNGVRGAARSTQCKNKMRNIFLASMNYSTSHGDSVPGYGRFTQIIPDGARNPGPEKIQCMPGHSWVVTLLPYLELQNVEDRWNTAEPFNGPNNAALGTLAFDITSCPSDTSAFRGGLSYVINSGFADLKILDDYLGAMAGDNFPTETQMHAHNMLQFDWDEDGNVSEADTAITRDTGMSWVHVGKNNYSQRLGQIYDGTNNTILFGENVNAGRSKNWADPSINNCAFVFPAYQPRISGRNFNNPPTPEGLTGMPNRERDLGEGTPFLSADHSGITNVVMAGGAIKSLSDSIDGQIYRAVLTPAGSKRRFAEFANEAPLGSSEF